MGWHSKVLWSNIVNLPCFAAIGRTVAEILRLGLNGFQNGSRPSSCVLKIEMLTAGWVNWANVRHRAKFRANRSNNNAEIRRFFNFI